MDKNEEFTEVLKAINGKLMSLSGYLITMRSDNSEKQDKISHDIKILLKQFSVIKRNIEAYLIIILLLAFFYVSKNIMG